jgi:hypothetical protein
MEKPWKKTWKKKHGHFFCIFQKVFFEEKKIKKKFANKKKLFEKYKKSLHVFFPCFFYMV